MNIQLQKKDKLLIFMVIAMILSYLTWYNFSALLNFIIEDIDLSPGQVGIILSAFQAGYVIAVLATGWLADQIGEKKVVLIATSGTAIFSTFFAFWAQSFWSVLLLRLIAGIFCGGIYVPGMSLLSNWFSPEKRGKSIGAYIGGLTFSYAASYFLAPMIASTYNWQIGILATSLPAFIAAFLVYKYVEDAPEHIREKNSVKSKNEMVEKENIQPAPEGGYKGPIFITFSYIGHMWELYGFWGWVGPFMVSVAVASGFEYVRASVIGGQLAALIILVGAPSVWLMGYISDKIGRTKTILICSIASLSAQFIFGFMHGKSLIITVIIGIWIGFWVIADSASFSTGLTEMVKPKIRATSLGIQNSAGFLITVISPAVFGQVLEYYNNVENITFASQWFFPFATLGLGALLAPIAAILLRKIKQSNLMSNGKK
ncbi:MAG TPA: MFS transporter [Halanaerobiales bacterium]|nr:MFS transporter [Halanaerobiales bacterium]